MKSAGVILCAFAISFGITGEIAAEDSRDGNQSDYAPGFIRKSPGGWNVQSQSASFFVADHELRDVPEEVAPVAALFRARSVETRSWGWVIFTRPGKIDVFKGIGEFTITTPRETFYVRREIGQEYILSPGRPGTRQISVEEYRDQILEQKQKPKRP